MEAIIYYIIAVSVYEQPYSEEEVSFTFEAKGGNDFNGLRKGMIGYIPKFSKLHGIADGELLIKTEVTRTTEYIEPQSQKCIHIQNERVKELDETFNGIYKQGEFTRGGL